MRAAPLVMPDSGRAELQKWGRSSVLLAGDGVAHAEIARRLSVSRQTAINWRARYLDRAAPTLPMQIGIPERQTHDYVRHGTTTLFAALDIATGKVTGLCKPRHRHQEFLALLKQV